MSRDQEKGQTVYIEGKGKKKDCEHSREVKNKQEKTLVVLSIVTPSLSTLTSELGPPRRWSLAAVTAMANEARSTNSWSDCKSSTSHNSRCFV